MDVLQKQIHLARRRLMLQRFLVVLAWCWFAALLTATLAIGASKIWPLSADGGRWAAWWLGGSLAAGVVAALAWTVARRQSILEAAIEIDQRFGLKERISTTVALSAEERESAIGQALVHDSVRRIDRLNVAERFRLKWDRRALLPLVPALAAFGLALFVDTKGRDNQAVATTAAPQAQVRKSTQTLQKKLADRRDEARKKGLKDAADLFKKLEDGTNDLANKQNVDRKQALVKLKDLAKDLERRKEQLSGDNQLKQQLNQLNDLNRGPADKLAQALKHGDFAQAKQELDKLRADVEKSKLDPQGKQELAKQLDQLKDNLQKIADAHQQARKELQKQIDQQRQAGQLDKADKLQQQLDRLAKQKPQMDRLSKMAQKLGECSNCMKQGQGGGRSQGQQATKALSELADELAQMQLSQDEMAMIDEALDQLADAKHSMDCKNCGGVGCEACQGGGMQDGKFTRAGGGPARASGPRPIRDNKTGQYDSNVRQKVGQGAAVVTRLVDGPNRKGQVLEEIKAEQITDVAKAADPLTGQKLPRDKRSHAQDYFDALRKQ